MLRVLTMLVVASVCYADEADDIVKKAILTSDKSLEKDKVETWDTQVQKVIKKANGDVETYYVVTNRGVIGISETSERPVQREPEFKETGPDPMDGIYVIVNQRKYRFSGLTPKEAAAALRAQGGSPAFVDRNNVQIAAPSWWQEPTVRIAAPPQAPVKVPCGMPAPVYPTQLPVFPQINPLSPAPNPAARAPQRQAPQVASGFPTTRATRAPAVARSNTVSPAGIVMGPTTTYAAPAAMGGGTKPPCPT